MKRMLLLFAVVASLISYCYGKGECMPQYGRYMPADYFIEKHDAVYSWEACGQLCHQHKTCLTWSWNVPLNDGAHNYCNLYNSYPDVSVQNADWITGPETCYRSNMC